VICDLRLPHSRHPTPLALFLGVLGYLVGPPLGVAASAIFCDVSS
jgi:hypothetical protein